jgi:septal ring factor EnvC (AmiA/AmiB activator)
MNVLKKILYFVAAGYFVLSIIGGAVLQSRLGQARQLAEYYRIELESAENREQQLADTVDKCWESTERTNQILSQSADTIQDIRRQLQEVRENYENMENMLLDSYDSMHSRDDNTGIDALTNYIKQN